ncbi:MAG TPA: hypothetical protein EYN79_07075 [Planctomycetes bacterium]|nr:hypothetical protein [Planctomycetota bacterium]HIN79774.1 hypothetical protein [Planctomycetota bacterium]
MSRLLILLPLLLVACNSTTTRIASESSIPIRNSVPHEEAQQLIFFAVIEGLYRDGVDTRTASAIAEIEEPAGIPHNFVYACPICTPALDAVRLYAARPGFYRDKQGRDTFGPGLDPELDERLLSADVKDRRKALQDLIEKWVDERIATSGFDEEKRGALLMAFREMRKQGMGLLQQFQSEEGPDIYLDFYRDWDACPSCDGANDAGQ